MVEMRGKAVIRAWRSNHTALRPVTGGEQSALGPEQRNADIRRAVRLSLTLGVSGLLALTAKRRQAQFVLTVGTSSYMNGSLP